MTLRPLVLLLGVITALLVGCGGSGEKDLLASAREFVEKREYKSAVLQLKTALQKNAQSGEARFLLGKSLLELGDIPAAVVELRKAHDLKYEPDRVVPVLANAMLQQGEHRAVVTNYGAVELTSPQAKADLRVALATAQMAVDQKDRATADLAEAIRLVPDHPGAKLLMARIAAVRSDYPEAQKLVDEVLVKDPSAVEGWMLKGELQLIATKDRKAALAAFRKAIEVKPEHLPAHIAAVSTLFAENDAAAATLQVAEMKKRFANQPRTRMFEAELAFNAKDYKAAREHIRPVVQAFPNNALALQIAGAAEFRLGSLQQAETYLGKALQVAPELAVARRTLAQVYLRTAQAPRAITTLQPLLERNPNAATLQLAAEAHLQAGDVRQAELMFERAAKLKPDDARIRTALALSQFGKGKTDSAISELESIASTDKGALAELALVSAHLRKKEVDKALKVIDQLEKKQPDKPLAPMLRGRVLVLKKDIDGARKNFERSLQIDPLYFPAAAGMAALDLALNKSDEARKHFDKLLAADPTNAAAKQSLATLLVRTGNTSDEVAQLLTSVVKASPSDVRAQLALVNFYLGRGDSKLAMAAAREASTIVVDQPDILLTLGRTYLAANDMQQAITTFNRLATLQPKSPQPHLGLADAHMALKDRGSATRSLKRALEIDPKLIHAHRGLVSIALAERQPSVALEAARTVQKQWPAEAVGWVLEGDVEASRKNTKAALTAYQAALRKDNAQEAATRAHGAMVAAGQVEDAEKFAQRWIAEHPTDALFSFYLADRALAARDYALAESRYREVVRMQPNNALALNNVAWLMVQQNKPGAIEYAERANRLLPGRPPLMDTLASVLAQEKQLPRALEVQKKAVDRAPEEGGLRMNLAKLYLQSEQKAMARQELEKLEKMGRSRYANQDEVTRLLKSL
jgi:cellulose synthase operon protein C